MNKELARTLTAALAQFIDANRKEGAMCMSSYECELMEQTFMRGDFDQIEIYLKKKLNLDLTVDAPEGLEEAAENIYKTPFGTRAEDFIAGAEWQARQLLQGSPMPEDTVLFNNGVAEGRRLEREDMLKDTVEHYVIGEIAGSPVGPVIVHYDDNLTIGDKVRIVVLKDNEDESK